MNPIFTHIDILGAPIDLGAGHRGVDAGPAAFRIAGIKEKIEQLGFQVRDRGDIPVPIPEVSIVGDKRQKFLKEITKACEIHRLTILSILAEDHLPLVLGGDHSIAIGTIAALSGYYRSQEKEIGLLWFDAHGDMNTPETSPSGNIHGMPLSASLGFGADELVNLGGFSPKLKPEKVVIIGLRDVDVTEKKIIRESGVHTYTMTKIDEMGMSNVIREALEIVTDGTCGFHLSFDIDGLDPGIAPGVGTPSRGGVNYREAHLFMEKVAAAQKMIGLEIVELNPIRDSFNQTAELGVELIESALGKRIL